MLVVLQDYILIIGRHTMQVSRSMQDQEVILER